MKSGDVTLVIGATGTVGREVVAAMLAAGQRPRALVRDVTSARLRLGHRPSLAVADLDRPETVARALDGIDRVFLSTPFHARQAEREEAIVAAAERAGVSRLVKLSCFGADGSSPLQVARHHHRAEQAVERSGLAWTIVRPLSFMQNLPAMVQHGAIATAARDGRVGLVDARDVAAVAVAALDGDEHTGRTYTATGPRTLTFDEVAASLSRQLGRTICHARVEPRALQTALRAHGSEPSCAADTARLHALQALGYEDLVTADVLAATGADARSFEAFVARPAGPRHPRRGEVVAAAS